MDFSRVEAGRLEGHFRPVQLGTVTADLSSLFRSSIEKSGIQFEVDCDNTSKQLTYVDPELVGGFDMTLSTVFISLCVPLSVGEDLI